MPAPPNRTCYQPRSTGLLVKTASALGGVVGGSAKKAMSLAIESRVRGLAIMTRRMRTRLLSNRALLRKRGQTLDETAWQNFLRRFYPEEQRFLRRYFAEVRAELARVIHGTLASAVAGHSGRNYINNRRRRTCGVGHNLI